MSDPQPHGDPGAQPTAPRPAVAPPGKGAERLPPESFDRFSQRARQVMALAQEEAQRFNHSYIGTEHLLLALVREGEGVAAKVLTGLGVELPKVRDAVQFIIGRGDRAPIGQIGLTPRARKVIELAVEEARDLGHHYVGTEHLLLGLVREGEGIAAGVLGSLGVKLKSVRRETMAVLTQGGAATPRGLAEAALTPKDNVVTCRVDAYDLAAIDTLVEAGIRSTRSDAASWLIHAGITARQDLFTKVNETVTKIRSLRQEAQTMAQELATGDQAPPSQPRAQPPTQDESGPTE